MAKKHVIVIHQRGVMQITCFIATVEQTPLHAWGHTPEYLSAHLLGAEVRHVVQVNIVGALHHSKKRMQSVEAVNVLQVYLGLDRRHATQVAYPLTLPPSPVIKIGAFKTDVLVAFLAIGRTRLAVATVR